jgi:uncharacterized protein YdaU (DUF1376 family)
MRIRRMDWYFDDYIAGTFNQLTFEEHGFYIVAINVIGQNNDWAEIDFGRLAHAGNSNRRTARRLLDQLVAKGKLAVQDGRMGQRRTLLEMARSMDRMSDAHRAAAAAAIANRRKAKPLKSLQFGQTFGNLKPKKKTKSGHFNELTEPRGGYLPPEYDLTLSENITDAARDPAPSQSAPGRAPAKPDPRLEALAAKARAKFLKGEP